MRINTLFCCLVSLLFSLLVVSSYHFYADRLYVDCQFYFFRFVLVFYRSVLIWLVLVVLVLIIGRVNYRHACLVAPS